MKIHIKKMNAKPNPRLVLSYNICFQAMCHDGTGSAPPLGKACEWSAIKDLTICAQNMAKFIDGVPSAAGQPSFDFVGLQEANNVRALQAAAPNTLAKMSMVESNTHPSGGRHKMFMASFYNPSKYKLLEKVCSHFNSEFADRPFHILLLEDLKTLEKILFINVHVPHRDNENKKFHGHTYRSFDAVAYDLSLAAKGMDQFDPNTPYTIIAAGDFNETGWDKHQRALHPMKWQPLQFAGLLGTTIEISNIVFSCSQETGCWHGETGGRGGDYIFSSGTPAKISVPSNYVFAPEGACENPAIMKGILQSDHLPVMSILA